MTQTLPAPGTRVTAVSLPDPDRDLPARRVTGPLLLRRASDAGFPNDPPDGYLQAWAGGVPVDSATVTPLVVPRPSANCGGPGSGKPGPCPTADTRHGLGTPRPSYDPTLPEGHPDNKAYDEWFAQQEKRKKELAAARTKTTPAADRPPAPADRTVLPAPAGSRPPLPESRPLPYGTRASNRDERGHSQLHDNVAAEYGVTHEDIESARRAQSTDSSWDQKKDRRVLNLLADEGRLDPGRTVHRGLAFASKDEAHSYAAGLQAKGHYRTREGEHDRVESFTSDEKTAERFAGVHSAAVMSTDKARDAHSVVLHVTPASPRHSLKGYPLSGESEVVLPRGQTYAVHRVEHERHGEYSTYHVHLTHVPHGEKPPTANSAPSLQDRDPTRTKTVRKRFAAWLAGNADSSAASSPAAWRAYLEDGYRRGARSAGFSPTKDAVRAAVRPLWDKARSLVTEAAGDNDVERLKLIAHTELVRAHADGTLAGVAANGGGAVAQRVEARANGSACGKCLARAGKTVTVNQARGLIPFHPRCRCSWVAVKEAGVTNAFCPTGPGGGVDPTCTAGNNWPGASAKVRTELDRVSSSFTSPDLSSSERQAVHDWKTGNSNLLRDEGFIQAVEKGRVIKEITVYRAGGTATDRALEFTTREGWARETAEASGRQLIAVHLKPGDAALFVPHVTDHHLVEVGVMLPPSTMIARRPITNVFCPTGPGGGVDPSCSPHHPRHADLGLSSLAGLTHVKGLGGSTGAQLYKNAEGKQFVVKSGDSPGHVRNEQAADDAYRAAGVPVPKSKLVEEVDGQPRKVSRYLDDHQTLAQWEQGKTQGQKDELYRRLGRHALADVLFGNWDVVGLGKDNVLVSKNGTPVRADNGGALAYRAQGAKKEAGDWNNGSFAKDLAGMADASKNPQFAAVVKQVPEVGPGSFKDQAGHLWAKRETILAAAEQHSPKLKLVLDERLQEMAKVFQVGPHAEPPVPVPSHQDKLAAPAQHSGNLGDGGALVAYVKANPGAAKWGESFLSKVKFLNPDGASGGVVVLPKGVGSPNYGLQVEHLKQVLPAGTQLKLVDWLSDQDLAGPSPKAQKVLAKVLQLKGLPPAQVPAPATPTGPPAKVAAPTPPPPKPTVKFPPIPRFESKNKDKVAENVQQAKVWLRAAKAGDLAGLTGAAPHPSPKLEAFKQGLITALEKAQPKTPTLPPKPTFDGAGAEYKASMLKIIDHLEGLAQTGNLYAVETYLPVTTNPKVHDYQASLVSALKSADTSPAPKPVSMNVPPKLGFQGVPAGHVPSYTPLKPNAHPDAKKMSAPSADGKLDSRHGRLVNGPKNQAWANSLTWPEKNVISSWKGSADAVRKSFFETAADPSKPLTADAAAFKSALDKSENHVGLVYRGVHDKGGGSKYASELIATFKAIGVGGVWKKAAPHCTSPKTAVGVKFSHGQLLMRILSRTGAPIWKSDGFSDEMEVAGRPGVRYRVVALHENVYVTGPGLPSYGKPHKMVVDLEEIV